MGTIFRIHDTIKSDFLINESPGFYWRESDALKALADPEKLESVLTILSEVGAAKNMC